MPSHDCGAVMASTWDAGFPAFPPEVGVAVTGGCGPPEFEAFAPSLVPLVPEPDPRGSLEDRTVAPDEEDPLSVLSG